MSIALPLGLWALAWALGRRELRQFRHAEDIGHDVFVYSRGRLWRRMTGVAAIAVLGVTLAALGFFPASTPRGASIYMALLVAEVLVLLLLPLVDLWETARTAKPGDLTRQAGHRMRGSDKQRPE